MPDIDISEQLANVTAPTLVLSGENDPIVRPEQSRLIAELVPKSENIILNKTGHLPMVESQVEYDLALTNWVEKYL